VTQLYTQALGSLSVASAGGLVIQNIQQWNRQTSPACSGSYAKQRILYLRHRDMDRNDY
jgi:hypothetical protein